MALSTSQQRKIARQLGREIFERLNATANLATPDIEAAASDLEAFLVSNVTAINNALPAPFKTIATTAQKRLLLALVAIEIAGGLPVFGD